MILFRPVGLEELRLIDAAGMRAFPPRLPEQPIFYPVLNEEYARQIARDWNTKQNSLVGFVTRFAVDDGYVAKFEPHIVGSRVHEELWVPAEELVEFNRHIVGRIDVIAVYFGDGYRALIGDAAATAALFDRMAADASERRDVSIERALQAEAATLRSGGPGASAAACDDHCARLARARLALDGLSAGDAFGERFFVAEDEALRAIAERALPQAPWRTTDDTEMAVAVFTAIDRDRRIDRDALARLFADRYMADPGRGYGGTAHGILRAIAAGEHWSVVAPRAFGGMGSMGNGAAMRVAPLGAYFADDIDTLITEAAASAAPTHAHDEAVAGAIAVAVASAYAWRRRSGVAADVGDLLTFAYTHTPPGETRRGIATAMDLGPGASVQFATSVLGTGRQLSSPDTVPFALWCANRHLGSYEDALWTAVSGLGDRDTTCAIVGGVVALHVGAVPPLWLTAREPLR